MEYFKSQKSQLIQFLNFLIGICSLVPKNALAQNSMMGDGRCLMCGGSMGWMGMAFGSFVMIGVAAALIGLGIYLFRRSGPRSPGPR